MMGEAVSRLRSPARPTTAETSPSEHATSTDRVKVESHRQLLAIGPNFTIRLTAQPRQLLTQENSNRAVALDQ